MSTECNKKSPTLEDSFKTAETGDLEDKVNFLKECGVNPKYLEMLARTSNDLSGKLVNILGKNPAPEEVAIVNGNLDMTKLAMEIHTANRVRSIISSAADDYKEEAS